MSAARRVVPISRLKVAMVGGSRAMDTDPSSANERAGCSTPSESTRTAPEARARPGPYTEKSR